MSPVGAFLLIASIFACSDAFVSSKASSFLLRKNSMGKWPLPVLQPTQHSYFSTSASKSASFMTRYFKNTKLLKSSRRSGQKTSVVEYCPRADEECMIIKFVEVENSKHLQKEFVKSSQDEWNRVAETAMGKTPTRFGDYRHDVNYSSWIDFHDGICGESFNVDLAIKDGLMLQKYPGPLRLALPGTVYSLELIGGFSKEDDQKLKDYAGTPWTPDLCRDNERGQEAGRAEYQRYWWKSTFASCDPEAAADFAVRALGAQRIETPFVTSHKAEVCPVVRWLVLPRDDDERARNEKEAKTETRSAPHGLMLHFVRNDGWPSGKMTTDDYCEDQERTRHTMTSGHGHFDEYMYNHVGFQAASLDPFIERFQELNLPFIARKSADGFALYVNVPKNNLVFKISSPEAPTALGSKALAVDEAP